MSKKCISKILLICLLFSINQAKCDSSHVGLGAIIGMTGTIAAKIVYDKFLAKEEIKEEEVIEEEIIEEEDLFSSIECIEVTDKTFADFIGQDELVEQVKSFVEAVSRADQYKERGVPRDKGLLLVGDAGSGKAALAHIIASELNALIIPVSADDLISAGDDALESCCEALFDFAREKAKERKVVVLIDHMEKIDIISSRDVLRRLFASIEDDHNIVFIGEMTISEFDSHFISFDEDFFWELGLEKFYISPPNLLGRQKILMHCLEGCEFDPSIDYPAFIEKLSRMFRGTSFDFLQNFIDKVRRVAIRKGSDVIKAEHFEEVLWQLEIGNKSNIIQTEEDLRKTAGHEAGHALVMVKTGVDVCGVSIAPGERTLGMAFGIDDKMSGNKSKIDYMHAAMISLAGPCAEDMVNGCITDGCFGDVEHASTCINTMITRFGMGDNDCEMVLDTCMQSERMKEAFDQCILDVFQLCKTATRMLLQRYYREHDALTNLLLKRETVSAEDIYEITGLPVDEATELLV